MWVYIPWFSETNEGQMLFLLWAFIGAFALVALRAFGRWVRREGKNVSSVREDRAGSRLLPRQRDRIL